MAFLYLEDGGEMEVPDEILSQVFMAAVEKIQTGKPRLDIKVECKKLMGEDLLDSSKVGKDQENQKDTPSVGISTLLGK
jgi:hypothetical protein